MAYIQKLTDKPRNKPWLARVRRKGHKQKISMHATRKDAEKWGQDYENALDRTGKPPTIEQLKQRSVGEIVKKYLEEITPTKASHAREKSTLKQFLERDICKLSLAYVERKDAIAYLKDRLSETFRGKPIAPSTVRREFNFLQDIFEKARIDWSFQDCPNPFRGIEIKGSKRSRDRELQKGELEKLEQACEKCRGSNQYYVTLAIRLAILTGMRLQEIFNLQWRDISVERKEIKIRKSKTDDKQDKPGRTIALPFHAEHLLLQLAHVLIQANKFNLSDRIFPMTKGAFSQAWLAVVSRAGISDLHFHDLRHEATSLFRRAGLDVFEIKTMLGHKDKNVTEGYIHVSLKLIKRKLDRHTFGGGGFALYGLELPPEERRVGNATDEEFEKYERACEAGFSIEEAAQLLDDALKAKEFEKQAQAKDNLNVIPFRPSQAT